MLQTGWENQKKAIYIYMYIHNHYNISVWQGLFLTFFRFEHLRTSHISVAAVLAISYRGGIGWLALVVTLRLGFLCLLFDLEESSDGETVGKTLSLQVTCLTATAAMRVWKKKNLRRLPALSRGLRRHQA